MPMIDVYAPKDLLPDGSDRKIGEALTMALLRAEGVASPGRAYLENTAAFIHRMEPSALRRRRSRSREPFAFKSSLRPAR